MASPLPEVHVGAGDNLEPELPLATDGVRRYVWHGRFGDMLIEVEGDKAFVNGEPVRPAEPAASS
ncbi:hypothetical protein HLB44_30955 [Aquincola sp. S2]|uniref:Uncharacterized protein n=1 Tax=Pseudaquabacterium terrae TaxID=2732868 RepID=A0ABX2ES94_9BURK|nr:hypothetical protein [Aquabacterium terrae]NRF71414.1 hypothetical protein [Aquabacterium terrae]